jgi:hypothetical protein
MRRRSPYGYEPAFHWWFGSEGVPSARTRQNRRQLLRRCGEMGIGRIVGIMPTTTITTIAICQAVAAAMAAECRTNPLTRRPAMPGSPRELLREPLADPDDKERLYGQRLRTNKESFVKSMLKYDGEAVLTRRRGQGASALARQLGRATAHDACRAWPRIENRGWTTHRARKGSRRRRNVAR